MKTTKLIKLDEKLLADLMASWPAHKGVQSIVAPMKRRGRDRLSRTYVDRPALPRRRALTPAEHWKAHLWMIDTAQAHGPSRAHDSGGNVRRAGVRYSRRYKRAYHR